MGIRSLIAANAVRLLSGVVEVAGIVLIAAGCWLIAPWLGLIVAGLGLITLGMALDPPNKAGVVRNSVRSVRSVRRRGEAAPAA